jgi:hypothetical protein
MEGINQLRKFLRIEFLKKFFFQLLLFNMGIGRWLVEFKTD